MKSLTNQIIALPLFIIALPLWAVLAVLIKLEDGGSVIFLQKRLGADKKPFTLYKFRTMAVGADKMKKNYLHLNEVDGPAFKIKNDPRYTKIGKFLAHTGLDELPQLINIIKGEMAFVGPRPLPPDEARKVPKKYHKRFSTLPGITSLWVVRGAHRLSFQEWMEADLEYVKNRSLLLDFKIAVKTIGLMLKWLARQIFDK